MGKWAKFVANAREVVALVNTDVWVGVPLRSLPSTTTRCRMHLARIASCCRRAVLGGLRLFHPTVQNVQATSCRFPLHSLYPCSTTIMDSMSVAPPSNSRHSSLQIFVLYIGHDLFLFPLPSRKALTIPLVLGMRVLPYSEVLTVCLRIQDFSILFQSACQAHHHITPPIILLLPLGIRFKTVLHRTDRSRGRR